MNVVFYLKIADALRESGLDLIREYIPDSPVYNPEDEPSQYNIPYVPPSPVYPSPVYNPPSPEYTPLTITTVPELDLIEEEKKEENGHIKEFPPGPWNDSAFTLQERLDQVRWESMEPEPNYELYGVNRGDEQRQEILFEVGRMCRCVDQMKKMLQTIGEFQDNLNDFMIQKATIKLQVNQISRNVEEITHTLNAVSESQDSIKSILKDLYDIINDMNNPDRSDSLDFELLLKINDISNRITQVNLGQESVKEVMTELKSTLERKPENNKRGYYQTTDCDTPHYEKKVKQPRLSSDLNFAYFDRQYGEILEVPKNREVRRGLKKRFLELHETAQNWEILNYHLKVICKNIFPHLFWREMLTC